MNLAVFFVFLNNFFMLITTSAKCLLDTFIVGKVQHLCEV